MSNDSTALPNPELEFPHPMTRDDEIARREIGIDAICQGLIDGKSPRQLVLAIAQQLEVCKATGWKWYKAAQIRLAGQYKKDTSYKSALIQIAVSKRTKYVQLIFDHLKEFPNQFLRGMAQIMDIEKDTCALLGLYPDKNVNIRTEAKGDEQDVSPEEARKLLAKLTEQYQKALTDRRGDGSQVEDAEFCVVDDASVSSELAPQDSV